MSWYAQYRKEEIKMLNAIKRKTNTTYTENGAVTYVSTMSDCLDLFATVGALRNAEEQDIITRFIRAYAENADIAMKILFYARDIRGGLGERRTFRTILRWLANNHSDSVKKNLAAIAEYGRYDDMLVLLDSACRKDVLEFIGKQLEADINALDEGAGVSLLAKWLPSVNATNKETVSMAKAIAKSLRMSDAEYRKTLSRLRAKIRIIENNLREKDYTFDYAKQPSKAMYKYKKAFIRNDQERYTDFLNKVRKGEAKLHTAALMPYDIVAPLCDWWGRRTVSDEERLAMDTSWNALEDFGGSGNSIAVIDGSGSMYGSRTNITPASVALSLGIYFAEKNTGMFHNHFITFSQRPQLVQIKGRDIVEKVQYCESFNECANTNIQAVFELILSAAVMSKVPKEEMPETIYIISDMEFDWCADGASLTNFETAKRKYAHFGYKLPEVVFWNVESRHRQQPVTMNEQGVALVSGCTPRLFSMVASGNIDPYSVMMDVIGSERYEKIVA